MTKVETSNKKKITIGLCALVALIIVFGCIYLALSPKGSAGAKEVTITVTDDAGAIIEYSLNTDAEFLREAMDEADGLEYSGTESDYGLMVDTVNGVTADYNVDGAYWAFYVDGEYCQYGIDTQPIANGETYSIVYTK